MKSTWRGADVLLLAVMVVSTFLLSPEIYAPAIYAGNDVMGELQFEGKSKVEKTSGVWIDGEYVGYLKELKGSKKVLLLPGEHVITVRQDGFQEPPRGPVLCLGRDLAQEPFAPDVLRFVAQSFLGLLEMEWSDSVPQRLFLRRPDRRAISRGAQLPGGGRGAPDDAAGRDRHEYRDPGRLRSRLEAWVGPARLGGARPAGLL